MIGDRDDVTTDSSQIVQQQSAATTTATATQIRFSTITLHPSYIAFIPATKPKKIRKKKLFFHPALQNSRHFGFGPSSSFPQLWLQSIKLDSNKQYVSRLLRGYRRLKKLFKVRDPSLWSANLAYRKSPSSIFTLLAFFSFSSLRVGSKGPHISNRTQWKDVVAKLRAIVRD